MKKTLTVIVPCYNEADVIRMLYEEVSKVFIQLSDEYTCDLLMVNDGSSDSTLDIIKELALRHSDVKYISFSRNFGKEAAMLAGMKNAVKSDYIGIIDADLQNSPEYIIEMLYAVDKEGYDVAAARRENREGEAKFKSFLSDSFYKVINRLCSIKIKQSAQDFRIMKSKVVKAIIDMPEGNRFSKGIFTWVGFNVKWFSYENRERAAGTTKWSLKKLAKYAIDGILGFTEFPLRLPLYLGMLLPLVSLVLVIYGIVKECTVVNYSSFPVFSVAIMIFLTSAVLFSLGIIGEYLARTYNETKARPKYIISETNLVPDSLREFLINSNEENKNEN